MAGGRDHVSRSHGAGELRRCIGRFGDVIRHRDLLEIESLLWWLSAILGTLVVGSLRSSDWLAATAAKGTLVGSANLCAGTSDSDWNNGGGSTRSCRLRNVVVLLGGACFGGDSGCWSDFGLQLGPSLVGSRWTPFAGLPLEVTVTGRCWICSFRTATTAGA